MESTRHVRNLCKGILTVFMKADRTEEFRNLPASIRNNTNFISVNISTSQLQTLCINVFIFKTLVLTKQKKYNIIIIKLIRM